MGLFLTSGLENIIASGITKAKTIPLEHIRRHEIVLGE